MAAGDLITGPWQIELQGVLMDALGCDGLVVTEWLTGFGVPSGRRNVVPRPLQQGAFPGPQYMDTRALEWGVAVVGDSWAEVRQASIDLGTALAPIRDTDSDYVVPLHFTLDDGTKYRVMGMPERAEWGYQTALRTRAASRPFNDGARCAFIATDPRIYAEPAKSATASLGSSSGGLGFPHGFPHGFGSATSGAAVCLNAGNIETYPVITITANSAGASGIRLLQETTGEEWSITLTLGAGETLTVDMGNRTALLNGTASRAPFVNRPPSVWFGLEPGSNSIRLQATGTGTVASVAWNDAYLL
jgi:hypothetical protein